MIKWPLIGLNGQFGECEKGLIQALNENFFLLDVLVQASFIDFVADEESLPSDPEESDVYILQDTKEIAIYKIDEWVFLQPQQGWGAYIKMNDKLYYFNGVDWIQNDKDFVIGPETAINNGIARFDGTTGKVIEGSIVTLNDDGDASQFRDLTLRNLKFPEQIISDPLSGDPLDPKTLPVLTDLKVNITSGAGMDVLGDITDPERAGSEIHILTNKGAEALVKNNSRIITGTGKDLKWKTGVSLWFQFSQADNAWYVVGGAGGGSGSGGYNAEWKPTWENGGELDTEMQRDVILLELERSAIFEMKVSSLYEIGTQKRISVGSYSPTNGAKYRLELLIELYKNGQYIMTAVSDVTSDIEVLNALGEQYHIMTFDATDATGIIDSEQLEPNDQLRFIIKRIAASDNEEAEKVRLLVKGAEVFDV